MEKGRSKRSAEAVKKESRSREAASTRFFVVNRNRSFCLLNRERGCDDVM